MYLLSETMALNIYIHHESALALVDSENDAQNADKQNKIKPNGNYIGIDVTQ